MKKNNKKPFFRFIKSVVKIFNKKPRIINPENIIDEPCIYISNHAASYGPTKYELYFPTNFQIMSAYQMCESIKERWRYLYEIYFHQKRKVPKWLSSIIATVITPFMIMFYKGMQIIPIYSDSRFRKTIDECIKTINKGISVIMFPEDSSAGYYDEMKFFFGGFWIIAKEYYKKYKKDIKIVNMYLHRNKNTILVDTPRSYLSLCENIKNHKEAATFFLNNTNKLFKEIENL